MLWFATCHHHKMFWLTKNPVWTCPMLWDILFWPSLQNVLKVVVRTGGWEWLFGIVVGFFWDCCRIFLPCLQNVLKVVVRNGGWERQFWLLFLSNYHFGLACKMFWRGRCETEAERDMLWDLGFFCGIWDFCFVLACKMFWRWRCETEAERDTDNFSSFSPGRKSIFAAPWHPTIYRGISENVRKYPKNLENVRCGKSLSCDHPIKVA